MSDSRGSATDEVSTTGRLLRVLIVDDTEDIRFLVRLTLERDGRFEVVGEAGDGVEAIRAAAQYRPDVVLLDLSMPEMDGLEALPEIRAQVPESKIVVLSGFNAREMSVESLHRGASSYMEKASIADRLVPHILLLFPDHQRARAVPPAASPGLDIPAGPLPASETSPVADANAELISTLAHELNNPVTILQGFATILQGGVDSMEPVTIKESAAAISRAARHLGALIEAFSDLRKVEVDALDLAFVATDVAQLIRETVTDMAEVTGTHPVIVEVVDGTVVSLDPLRVRQVLVNLLANAAKFSPAGTRIDVKLALDGGTVEISVRDHGPGIRADKLSELFRKFTRLDPEVPGTGIGLYLSRSIARAHGGDLTLTEANAPGCRFSLRLPLLRIVTDPDVE